MERRLAGIALATVMALFLAGCGGSNGGATTAADIMAADTPAKGTMAADTSTEAASTGAAQTESAGGILVVGLDQGFPPMGFPGDDGEFTGSDLELVQEVTKRLGLEYKPQPIVWDSKNMELESGNIDCVWNGFTMTGREDNYTWTKAYTVNTQVFVVGKDSGIISQADLAGKVVECQMDSSAEAALKEVPDLTTTFKELLAAADHNTAFMDLERGAVDTIAMDVVVTEYQIQRRNTDFVILGGTLSAEEYGTGFKKGNTELRDEVQVTPEKMVVGGASKSTSEKRLGEDVTVIGKQGADKENRGK